MHLLPALVRAERFDWLVQKATELGMDRLSPVMTERTIIRLSRDQAGGKVDRWLRIARESAQQCGRSTIPRIDAPIVFHEAMLQFGSGFKDQGSGNETPELRTSNFELILMPTLAIQAEPLREALNRRPQLSEAAVLIGPEGDFTPQEAARAVRQGAVAVSLGRRVLRSETAAIAVLAVLRHAAGEL